MPTPETNPQKTRRLVAVIALVAVGTVAWLVHQAIKQTSTPVTTKPVATNTTAPVTVSKPRVTTPVTSKSQLQEFTAKLNTAPDAKAARPHLAELRARLSAMSTNAAVAEIRGFLDSKTDGPTHLGFKVARNGWLDEAPTLRTFLLDELARIDPAAAADYARVILASKDSPDEWAVALRNLALGDASAEGRSLLEQKAGEMLRHEPWQREPSVGFLEAFDVAVFVGGTNLMPTLSDMIRHKDNPAVAHASFLTLDRLVINDTVTILTALQAAPEWMEGREQTRANYFARGDVRDPQQRQILESYLFDPRISPAELDTFAGIYPNANLMVSPNLLTQTQTPNRASLIVRDAESLRVVQQWLADARFAKLRPQLERVKLRLEEFVRQAQ